MEWHDDVNKMFAPLLDHVRRSVSDENEVDQTVSQYMYMGHDEEKTFFKHFGSRDYLHIDPQGELLKGEIEDWRKWRV